jgi:ubiquinone/menaquinone biosynthesis C-methylase UbiE
MPEHQLRFEDGAAYERMMGVWSRLAGEVFLDWVAPPPGLRWLDVGCGSGAFSELVSRRCAAAEIQGLDPSEAQLAYARSRPVGTIAQFHQGDALKLPFADNRFDAAAMALVIFFVPDPVKAVGEMARVVAPGGIVAAYAWDRPGAPGGGVPTEPIQAELRAMGFAPPIPPSADASRIEALRALWSGAGIEAVETREIAVTRSFADFDEFWTTTASGASIAPFVATLPADVTDALKVRVRVRLPADGAGRIAYAGRANAVKGRMPK